MKKTFGSAFALIMVALFTVAPASPATAYPGGIHLHMAGKVGQKAVGSTIIFGAEGLTEAPQKNLFNMYRRVVPNACLWFGQAIDGSIGNPVDINGWDGCDGNIVPVWADSGKNFQIPASGSFANQIPLPDLPAGKYQLWFAAWASNTGLPGAPSISVKLGVAFTIGVDGTFTAIGPACDGVWISGHCIPKALL